MEDAFEWYLERSLRAAQAFVREIDRSLAVISAGPSVWPRFEAGTRRYVLRRFPYSVIYREIEGGVEIVAFAHQKRRSHYWYERLRR